MQNHSHKYSLLVISIATPLLIGLYKDNILINSETSDKKTSEVLLPILTKYIDRYNIECVIYTRGPGSYMSIKLTYIMLKTLELIRGIKCLGCSGFTLNGEEPIKAIGNLYFIKEKETIITKKYDQPVYTSFVLPQCIQDLKIDEESTPEYVLPAV